MEVEEEETVKDKKPKDKTKEKKQKEFDFRESLSAVVEQEEPDKRKNRRRWNPLIWFKKSKKHDTDETDGKNKKEKKSKKKESKKVKEMKKNKTKEEKKVDTTDNKTKNDGKSEKAKWKVGKIESMLNPQSGEWEMYIKEHGSSNRYLSLLDPNPESTESEKEKQPSTSSLLATSADSIKHIVNQGTKKQTGSDSITQAAAPENKAQLQDEQGEATSCGVAQSHSSDCTTSLETTATVTKTGGVLEIPNTGVVLSVPPKALPKGMEQCELHLRIVPSRILEGEVPSFSSNSCAIVELLPDNLSLQCAARLSLPHCLVLEENGDRRAKIVISHHKKGTTPQWEEENHLSYHLEDTACIIYLDTFCWVTICINDEIVIAKKLVLYTAARNLRSLDKVAEIHAGYYFDLPDEKQVIQDTQDLVIAHRKIFYFMKSRYPLQISLENIFSSGWQYEPKRPRLQEINYDQIESSTRHSVMYTLKRNSSTAGNPLCVFSVSQENGQISVKLGIHLKAVDKDPSALAITEPRKTCWSQSPWREESNISYELTDSACTVHLKKFCCVKCIIDDKTVAAKRIKVYTAVKKMKESDELAEVEVGFYSDIPGGQELLRLNPNLVVDFQRTFPFMEKQNFHLQLSLDSILPEQWTCCIPREKLQEIPFSSIASSIEHSHLYILQKEYDEPGNVTCIFTAMQKEGLMQVDLSLRLSTSWELHQSSPQHSTQTSTGLQGEKVKLDTIEWLSKRLGPVEWKAVCRKLDLKDAELKQLEANDKNNIQEVIFQSLLKWRRRKGTAATVGILSEALKKGDRTDLAETILKYTDELPEDD